MRALGGFVAGYGGVEHVITQDFFGHVGRLPLGNDANTTLSTALGNVGTGNQPKQASRKVLAGWASSRTTTTTTCTTST